MPLTFWLSNEHIIVDDQNHPVMCSACPCKWIIPQDSVIQTTLTRNLTRTRDRNFKTLINSTEYDDKIQLDIRYKITSTSEYVVPSDIIVKSGTSFPLIDRNRGTSSFTNVMADLEGTAKRTAWGGYTSHPSINTGEWVASETQYGYNPSTDVYGNTTAPWIEVSLVELDSGKKKLQYSGYSGCLAWQTNAASMPGIQWSKVENSGSLSSINLLLEPLMRGPWSMAYGAPDTDWVETATNDSLGYNFAYNDYFYYTPSTTVQHVSRKNGLVVGRYRREVNWTVDADKRSDDFDTSPYKDYFDENPWITRIYGTDYELIDDDWTLEWNITYPDDACLTCGL